MNAPHLRQLFSQQIYCIGFAWLLSTPGKGQTPGTLDSTFGSGGQVTISNSNVYTGGEGMALQTDGRILILTSKSILRLNPDGSLDPSFNGSGKITINSPQVSLGAAAIALQSDGKILVTGEGSTSFLLLRYNADGSVDTSFNGGGVGQTPAFTFGGTADYGSCIAVQSDGKIIVGGSAYVNSSRKNDFALARWNQDGTLDSSFGGTGKVITAYGNADDRIHGIALAADGKIFVAGRTGNTNSHSRITVAKFNTDGSLDGAFGTGIVTALIGAGNVDEVARAIAIQNDNKIVVGGYYYSTQSSSDKPQFVLVRFNTNGTLDSTFSGDGKFATVVGPGGGWGYCMALQGDGKILLAGHASVTGSSDGFGLIRVNTNGSLDTSFNGSGQATVDVPGGGGPTAVLLQVDGKILLTGATGGSSPVNMTVMRFHSGSLLPGIFVEREAGSILVDGSGMLDFGYSLIGSMVEKALLIRNTGPGTLSNLALTIDTPSSDQFAYLALETSSIPAGGIITIKVRFTPTTQGTSVGGLHIANNVPGAMNPFDINLAGRGLQPEADDDGDGLSNVQETGLAQVGLQLSPIRHDGGLIALLQGLGLYRKADVLSLRPGLAFVLPPGEVHFKLLLHLESSDDLSTFSRFPITPEKSRFLEGQLELDIFPQSNHKFFKLQSDLP